jgi:predicted amidophosphoribosyltransferase
LLKYRNIKSVDVRLGNEIGMKVMNDTIVKYINLIAPIRLHKLKQRERGYNQSEYLCKGVSEVAKVEFISNLIVRKKNTQIHKQNGASCVYAASAGLAKLNATNSTLACRNTNRQALRSAFTN